MSTSFRPPMSVHFIWHPYDAESVNPIIEEVRKTFARDKDRPFSRGLNIPLFFYSSKNPVEVPDDGPSDLATRNIIFVFTSVNTAGVPNWRAYVEGLKIFDTTVIIPVALDKNGINHGGSLKGINCIRSYDWPQENKILHAILFLAHEIYRYGLSNITLGASGKNSSIKLFLSHAKTGNTGLMHAESIKRFVDETNMRRFFDATEISPGFSFEQEIETHIIDSTLLAIGSDAYSSRYWCQREILSAKKQNRPIVAVNCLEDYEDRIFPAASNIPCVHVSSDTPLSDKNILRILSSAMLETIRLEYALKSLEYYKTQQWIDSDCELYPRPIEIRHALSLVTDGKTKICYPEPPIYSDEADWHDGVRIEAYTPLWKSGDRDLLKGLRVGISISDAPVDGFSHFHLHSDHLIRLTQDVARHLLARSTTLLYGGDLRQDGFTEFILDEASVLKDRLPHDPPHVENHLAWPLHVSGSEIIAWRAKYAQVMKTVSYGIPAGVADGIAQNVFLTPNCTENKYIWSRCLTEMRVKSIESSAARICAGGKLAGYSGKMPGVLEEIIIALQNEKPIYLLGAFGGVVGEVCLTIDEGKITPPLTEDWQVKHNDGYADLQEMALLRGGETRYEEVKKILELLNVDDLATRAGLSRDEYGRLMCSPFVDECVHLILKGLQRL